MCADITMEFIGADIMEFHVCGYNSMEFMGADIMEFMCAYTIMEFNVCGYNTLVLCLNAR